MAKITKIDITAPLKRSKQKVAAYARVSVDSDAMSHSLATQTGYYSALIQSNPEWEYAGVYADYGISGTSRRNRQEFNRMVADAEQGRIDIILTKSISRFARNTVDLLETVRHLKECGVEVRFEREHINSLSGDGELMLSILASFAQEESRSISENCKWAIRKNFELGIPNGYMDSYGYAWDGEVCRVVPEQGQVVKRIFAEYLAGASAYSIAKNLQADGVTTRAGRTMTDAVVKEILGNPTYTGTAVFQKYYFTDAKERRTNHGELPRYAVEGLYEPLISTEDFEKAQEIRQQRAAKCPPGEKTVFSGKMVCGTCGRSISRRSVDGKKKWVCNTRERRGVAACNMRPVSEDELFQAWDSIHRVPFKAVTIFDDRISFTLDSGKNRDVNRSYGGRKKRNGFSGRLVCGCCGGILMRRQQNLKTGKEFVWRCTKPKSVCSFGAIYEREIRKATQEMIGSDNYEGRFLRLFEKAVCFPDRIEFHYKEGGMMTWERK